MEILNNETIITNANEDLKKNIPTFDFEIKKIVEFNRYTEKEIKYFLIYLNGKVFNLYGRSDSSTEKLKELDKISFDHLIHLFNHIKNEFANVFELKNNYLNIQTFDQKVIFIGRKDIKLNIFSISCDDDKEKIKEFISIAKNLIDILLKECEEKFVNVITLVEDYN